MSSASSAPQSERTVTLNTGEPRFGTSSQYGVSGLGAGPAPQTVSLRTTSVEPDTTRAPSVVTVEVSSKPALGQLPFSSAQRNRIVVVDVAPRRVSVPGMVV